MSEKPTIESLQSDIILLQDQLTALQSDIEAYSERLDEMEQLEIADRIDRNAQLIRLLGQAIKILGQSSGFLLAGFAAILVWSTASQDTRTNASDKIVGEGLVPVAIGVIGLGIQVYSRRKVEAVESTIAPHDRNSN